MYTSNLSLTVCTVMRERRYVKIAEQKTHIHNCPFTSSVSQGRKTFSSSFLSSRQERPKSAWLQTSRII